MGAAAAKYDDFVFTVSTMEIVDGHRLGTSKPDADGCYLIPCMIFDDSMSGNGRMYDVESLHKLHFDPQGRFQQSIMNGKLIGECGHPEFGCPLTRQFILEPKNEAWRIRGFGTRKVDELKGAEVGFIKVKPSGNYGKQVIEALSDPLSNACTSVRMISNPMDNSTSKFRPKVLITYDFVTENGVSVACERFAGLGHVTSEALASVIDLDDFRRQRASTVLSTNEANGAIMDFEKILDETVGNQNVRIRRETFRVANHGAGLVSQGLTGHSSVFSRMYNK